MALSLYDTFDGVFDTDLLDRPGALGTTWTRHPAAPASGTQNRWRLSGSGRVYTPTEAYAVAHYLASGTPAASEFDIRLPFRFFSILGDGQYGVTFRAHATADSYWRLIYETYSGYLRWRLILRTAGVDSTLGSAYADTPAADASRDVLVEVRDAGVAVWIDGTSRITTTETTTPGNRIGLLGLNSHGATRTTGIHLDSLMVGPAGFVPPIYGVIGPDGDPPLFESEPFTVALNPGANPGSRTVTPTCSGITGTFSPTSVTLLDADRTKTFTFTPTSTGTGSISFSDGTAAEDEPAHAYAAVYAPPAREAYWASRLYHRSSAGAAPYTAIPKNPDGSGGYYLDGQDHYDTSNAFRQVQEYSIRKGLAVTDYQDVIELAIAAYRDNAVRAPGSPGGEAAGVLGHHRFLTGIAWHSLTNPDLADRENDVEAADILCPVNSYTPEDLFIEGWSHVGVQREVAFFALATLDRAWMGLGEVTVGDGAVQVLLNHIAQWVEPEATKHYGVFLKPWMGGLTMRSLIRYWERYRGHADAEKVALCAAIPPAVEALLDYIWDYCWNPVGAGEPGVDWERGSLMYRDVHNDDPRWVSIEDVPITYVDPSLPRRVFRCASLPSTVDDYYNNATVVVGGIADAFTILDYVGATRQVTLLVGYPASRDLTTSDTITIRPPGTTEVEGGGGQVPDLNLMTAPAYAWMYWYKRRVEEDFEGSQPYRKRFHAMFNGSYAAWYDPYAQKQYNESVLWTVDGLDWAARGDSEWTEATTYTLSAPAAGAAGEAEVESGAFRISIPHGQMLAEPVEIVPASSTGLGTFSTPYPILSSDIRSAMFTFTPDAADDGTIVNISVSSTLTDPSAVAFAVGEVEGSLVAGSISITTAATATAVGLTVTEATGGTGPYTRQWHRSTTPGFTPDASNDLPGATSLTLSDTGLTAETAYYYKVVQTDTAAASVTTAQQAVTTSASSASSLLIDSPAGGILMYSRP